ncbi:MAG: hypothetical protein POELPBGB_01342 [Bacteroidia bacterium]|nr:hypothetical protein [Bacteroidia bacterium]
MMQEKLQEATDRFYAWEKYGRGYLLYPYPVHVEPPYMPLYRFQRSEKAYVDDGRVPSLFKRFTNLFANKKEPEKIVTNPEPGKYLARPHLRSFKIIFGKDEEILKAHALEFLTLCSSTQQTVAFEIIGKGQSVNVQITCSVEDGERLKSLWKAYFPKALLRDTNPLDIPFDDASECAIVDFGLEEEFMRPIIQADNFKIDPLISIMSAFEELREHDAAMLQIIFQGTKYPWAEGALDSVTDGRGNSFFVDGPEMVKYAREKVASPLFGVVIRLIVQSTNEYQTEAIAKHFIANISTVSQSGINSLVPLPNDGYPYQDHGKNVLQRRTNRLGMILSANELVSFVHYPNVLSNKLYGYEAKSKQVPSIFTRGQYFIGHNNHLRQTTPVYVTDKERLRHTHIVGATGTGKSNYLLHSIVQDMEAGNGLCVLDPHGDLIEKTIDHIPEHRIKDVVLLDPSDTDFPIGLNLLFAKTEPEKIILSSDIVSLFKRFATSWGDQMTSVLSNAVITFLEHEQGGTFLDLRHFLTDTGFRNQVLEKVQDPNNIYYWKKEFPLLRTTSIAPILTRLDTFLRPKIVRNMMAQKSGIDFHNVINSRKIFLVKLSQGLIGEDNSYLLGSIIVAKLHQAALHRQNIQEKDRLPFYLYIDEFQHFITPSMSAILSGARKYGLGLVLAHQDLEQVRAVDKELANSILSNPATRICFRSGEDDAKQLASGFSSFDETDVQNLETGHAIVKIERKDNDFNISVPFMEEKDEMKGKIIRNKIVLLSRSLYGKSREEVEELLTRSLQFSEKKEERKVEHKAEKKKEPEREKQAEPPPETKEPPQSQNQEKEAPKAEHKEAEPSVDEKGKAFTEKEIERQQIREHRYLQEFIKRMAEGYGFKAVIEEPTPDGQGRVDVGLSKEKMKIACEIAITNTKEYEVENIRKCFKAGYSKVFVCSNNASHLVRIKVLCEKQFSSKEMQNIACCGAQELFTYLSTTRQKAEEKIVKGYRVKTNMGSGNAGSQKDVADTILKSIRRKRQ